MGDFDGEQKELIKKLVNFRMIGGKRTRVRTIAYKTFHRLARTERDVIKFMVDVVDNIKPICEVVKVGVVGTIYDVSGIVARDRQHITAQDIILPPSIEIVDMTQPIANLT
ncbi:Os09g0519601 [Oryza sativa Japonica Group]|uniref:Os09g0519601 protein n=1 Tax=Oryza sativa subsp. japonica TaxID=39947 RepID=A0A0P0XQ97_ORYSJ|nr:hypothetical protein EE612_048990 [Oryza sativa]BAT09001.1 Os09g0519601 [Oryza sativa Japonica Group]